MCRLLRYGFLGWMLLSLTACVSQGPGPVQSQTKRYAFEHIDRIVVSGPVHLDVLRSDNNAMGEDVVIVNGSSFDLLKVKVVRTNNTLYIQSFSPIQANIRINRHILLGLTYNGDGDVNCLNVHVENIKVVGSSAGLINLTGIEAGKLTLLLDHVKHICLNKVHIQQLSIVASDIQSIEAHDARIGSTQLIVDSGTTEISGFINLRKLIASGHSVVNVIWVNAEKITVNAKDQAQIFLGGVAKWGSLTATQNAEIDVRYLRVNTVFAHAKDSSQIGLVALNELNAYAVDQAQIYYYDRPDIILSRYWRQNGTVLFGGMLPVMPVPPVCAPVPRHL